MEMSSWKPQIEFFFSALHQVEDFLGIHRHFNQHWVSIAKKKIDLWQFKDLHSDIYEHNYMSNQTRNILVDYFRPHSLNFFRIVSRTFKWQIWLQENSVVLETSATLQDIVIETSLGGKIVYKALSC